MSLELTHFCSYLICDPGAAITEKVRVDAIEAVLGAISVDQHKKGSINSSSRS
jgi:dsRNA-specific ribonuclease